MEGCLPKSDFAEESWTLDVLFVLKMGGKKRHNSAKKQNLCSWSCSSHLNSAALNNKLDNQAQDPSSGSAPRLTIPHHVVWHACFLYFLYNKNKIMILANPLHMAVLHECVMSVRVKGPSSSLVKCFHAAWFLLKAVVGWGLDQGQLRWDVALAAHKCASKDFKGLWE